MDNNEIKNANRKALPKFILIMVISMLIGGLIGFFAGIYGFNRLSDGMKNAGTFFGTYIAHWLMLAISIILPLICIPIYQSAKKLLSIWNEENEELSDAIDIKLSIIVWISSATIILSYFLIAASYSYSFENENNKISLLVSIVCFFAIMIEAIIAQQKCVDANKKTNPEKNVSVYDTKFQKKWLDSSDELERLMMGKCAFKAYSATNTICMVLSVILAICAIIFNIGFSPSLIVCLIWIINMSAYCMEALRYTKAGNKIS